MESRALHWEFSENKSTNMPWTIMHPGKINVAYAEGDNCYYLFGDVNDFAPKWLSYCKIKNLCNVKQIFPHM